jgi:hypothetical protein
VKDFVVDIGWGPPGDIPSIINLLKNAFEEVEDTHNV